MKKVLASILAAATCVGLTSTAFARDKVDPEDCDVSVEDVRITCNVEDGDEVKSGTKITFTVRGKLEDCDCDKHTPKYRIDNEDDFYDDDRFGTSRSYTTTVKFDRNDEFNITIVGEVGAYYDGEIWDSEQDSLSLTLYKGNGTVRDDDDDDDDDRYTNKGGSKITINSAKDKTTTNSSGNSIVVNGGQTTTKKPSTTAKKDTTTNKTPTLTEVTSSNIVSKTTSAVKSASNKKGVGVNVSNASSISRSALQDVAAAAKSAGGTANLVADTIVNNAVAVRYTIDSAQAAKMPSTIYLSGATDDASTRATFEKYYSNEMAFVSLSDNKDFGTTVKVAAKVGLSDLNTKTLKFYAYDKSKNSYAQITNPAYSVDKNGYLHFSTSKGNTIIITDSALKKK